MKPLFSFLKKLYSTLSVKYLGKTTKVTQFQKYTYIYYLRQVKPEKQPANSITNWTIIEQQLLRGLLLSKTPIRFYKTKNRIGFKDYKNNKHYSPTFNVLKKVNNLDRLKTRIYHIFINKEQHD